jgi:DNA-directed RNA polymerase I subunit RPA49
MTAATSEAEGSRALTPVQDYKAAKALLGETFGTKKVRQALHSQEKNQINMTQLESSSADFINRSLDRTIGRLQDEAAETSASSAVVPENASNIDAAGLLPPFDAQTGKVEEIYQLKDIIPTEAIYALPADEFSTDSTESWESIQKRFNMSDYVLDRIRNAIDLSDGGQKIRTLLYLHYLLRFRELKEGALNTEASLQKALPGAGTALLNHLLEGFSEPVTVASGQVRRKLSAICKDRLISYICVLSLIIDPGFRANLTVLSTVLHIPVTRMTDHFKAVGCTIEKPGKDEAQNYVAPGQTRSLQIRWAQLKAPLTFPKPKRGAMK